MRLCLVEEHLEMTEDSKTATIGILFEESSEEYDYEIYVRYTNVNINF